MPKDFCWKKGGDFGKIPTSCPAGYEIILALCFEHFREGYKHFLGICWKQSCDKDYKNHGLTCFRTIMRWYIKHAYIPRSLTNFNKEVLCPEGMYKNRHYVLEIALLVW